MWKGGDKKRKGGSHGHGELHSVLDHACNGKNDRVDDSSTDILCDRKSVMWMRRLHINRDDDDDDDVVVDRKSVQWERSLGSHLRSSRGRS